MTIWFDKELSVEKLKPLNKQTMNEHLGIEWTGVGENFIKATMPVDHRTRQPSTVYYTVVHPAYWLKVWEALPRPWWLTIHDFIV